jgi:hypothetical protein
MDYLQIFLAIIIPLAVSVIVWALTYIIPYIMPDQVSKAAFFFTKNDPIDPIEIRLLINQFLKYDDWKRLTARDRLRRMFKRKVLQIQADKENEWFNEKQKVTSVQIKEAIDGLKDLLHKISNDHDVKFFSENYYDKKYLEENEKKYSDIYKSHNNAKIWFYINQNLLPAKFIENLMKIRHKLTSTQLALLMDTGKELIDEEGSLSDKEVLRIKFEYYPPKPWNNVEISQKFNDLIIYIDYPHGKLKKELVPRLALGLSKHEKSSKTLISLITEVDAEILNKDFDELKKSTN